MKLFSAKILKIGVNPYVLLPASVLNELFRKSGKTKGPIPLHGTLNGNKFKQTLVKYSHKWRLYLNTPMRKAAGIDTGDIAIVKIGFDPRPRIIPPHPKLTEALERNKKAKAVFEQLSPSRQKEIIRYISFLKTEESLIRNIKKVIQHLQGKEQFAGRSL
jgi:hypothetical protein